MTYFLFFAVGAPGFRDSTWYGVGGQLAGGQHDVPEVEGGVVDAAELHVRVAGGEVAQRRDDPAQRGQVTARQHVHVGLLRQLLVQF